MFKPKKFLVPTLALLTGAIFLGSVADVSAAPTNSVASTTMKNSSIKNLTDDTRVFSVDKC